MDTGQHRGVRVFFRNGDTLEFPTADYAFFGNDETGITLWSGYEATSRFMNHQNSYVASFMRDDVRGYANMDIPFTVVKAA